MKKGLVLEGGGMRGMFTCGVTDVFMENGIIFDGAVGVSAGACFGCNYKSGQKGRAIRYNMRFCTDKRYISLKNWLKTGEVYGVDFCFRRVPFELDLWDTKAFSENPMEFYVVCTDAKTGEPVYHLCTDGLYEDVDYIRASSSMPVASEVVKIGDNYLMDGGVSDSIPIRFIQNKGYDRNVVILTRPIEYRKKKSKSTFLVKIKHRGYPALARAMETRHDRYNETLEYILEQEKMGKILVIRPPQDLHIPNLCDKPLELKRVYDMGTRVGEKYLDAVKNYLCGGKNAENL